MATKVKVKSFHGPFESSMVFSYKFCVEHGLIRSMRKLGLSVSNFLSTMLRGNFGANFFCPKSSKRG